ncbi:MAG: DUF4097 family beta strand repeat protein [Pyrinomonadaceae bacterium]|nr:DUF4097 family beta strand repeat protein [Pyrinomonadaceae bacterium]
MKTLFLTLAFGLSLAHGVAGASAAASQRYTQEEVGITAQGKGGEQRTTKTTSSVIVTVCEDGGTVTIHGWDRNEVSVANSEENRIRLRPISGAGESDSATKVEVLVSDAGGESVTGRASCNASADIELSVPRGAMVEVKTRGGDVHIANVAGARVETLGGDIEVRSVSKAVEAKTVSGDVDITESSGRMSVRAITGDINAMNARAASAGDAFEVVTVNGEITLERVNYASVNAASITGSINVEGALARGGRYDLRSNTGNIILNLAADASFRINARVTLAGTIITDFPVRYTGEQSASSMQRLTGVYGTGDALLNLISYSGTVHLRRK